MRYISLNVNMEYSCVICKDNGYLDISLGDIYCDCSAGVFYETRDEINLQIKYGLLDNGMYDSSSEYLYSDICEDDINYYKELENLDYLSELPFYIQYT